MNYEFNILYYINLFKKWWKTIIIIVGISTLLTLFLSLLMPVTYVSTVTLLSAEGDSSASSSLGGVGKLLGFSNFLLNTSSNDLIISILKSRRMAKDIEDQFKLDKKPKFKWDITINTTIGGLEIVVKGSDPALTEKIANFAIQNLDKINAELEVTASKPMVKVLDAASLGVPESRQIPRKMLVAAILAFLITNLYAFFTDYIKKLKTSPNN